MAPSSCRAQAHPRVPAQGQAAVRMSVEESRLRLPFADKPWRAATFDGEAPWLLPLDDSVRNEFDQGLDEIERGNPLPWCPGIRRALARVAHELDRGLGFVLMRGIPLVGRSDDSLIHLVG